MPRTLGGIIPAITTPFDANGDLAPGVIPDLVERLLADGVDGIFVCGTTGEFPSLTTDERRAVLEAVMRATDGRVPVAAHVGHDCLRTAAELARHAAGLGVDAVAAVPPHYFAPASETALVDCIEAVASAAPETPFYCYHIPARTGVAATVADLLTEADGRIPTLAGVKYTDGDLMDFRACVTAGAGRFACLAGRDQQLLAFLACGATGAVGSTYNLAAPLFKRLWNAFHAGDLDAARAGQDRAVEMVRVLFRHGGMPAIKAAASLVGPDPGPMRLPNRGLSDDQRGALRRDLDAIGFFEWGRNP